MTEEIIIGGELSCNNCLEKTRCKQQQEVKVKRIDAILSYITNEDNEKYIAELKNEIPAITRCDVALEKQLKRAEIEIEKLKGVDGSVHPDSAYYKITRLEQENFALTQESQQKSQTICELEQENKELKEKIIELSEEKGHLIVENNTLKESNQSLSMLGTDSASANETVRKEFFRADKNKDMWREKAEIYRSALEEIREINNKWLERWMDDSDELMGFEEIGNKINEVLG